MAEILESVSKSFTILSHIGQNPNQRLSDIARDLGETKPRILRMLRTMEHHGLVRRGAGGRYRLGIGALVLGTAASGQVDLVKLATPLMEGIVARVNETVQLRIVDNSVALCIAKSEPSRDLRVNVLIGRRRPLYAGSAKVLLAFMPRTIQEEILPGKFEALTGKTITDREQLFRRLERIRADGYCISRGEVNDQLVAAAVPVLSREGGLIAAMNIVAPAFRTQEMMIPLYTRLLQDASAKLTEVLSE